jgi:hypothetical protein
MTLSMADEVPAQTIARLQRELAHVSEQARVSHAMAMRWRGRALAAEAQCRRLQHRLQRKEAKEAPTPELLPDESGAEALSLSDVWCGVSTTQAERDCDGGDLRRLRERSSGVLVDEPAGLPRVYAVCRDPVGGVSTPRPPGAIGARPGGTILGLVGANVTDHLQ